MKKSKNSGICKLEPASPFRLYYSSKLIFLISNGHQTYVLHHSLTLWMKIFSKFPNDLKIQKNIKEMSSSLSETNNYVPN